LEIDNIIKIKEKELIAKYNTSSSGYNLTLGGDGCCGHAPSNETRLKMSKSRMGKKKILREDSLNFKKVKQYSVSGEFICEYPSIAIAARTVGAKQQHISRCCKGQRNKTRGFIWKFS